MPLRQADHSPKGVVPNVLIRLRNLRCEAARVLTRATDDYGDDDVRVKHILQCGFYQRRSDYKRKINATSYLPKEKNSIINGLSNTL
jgi:hypothetical protein